MRRFFHLLVGWSAMVAATLHSLAVLDVARLHGRGWFARELAIGFAVQLPALWMIRSAARLPARDGAALASSALLGGVCLWQLITWNAAFPALFLVLAMLDGVLLTLRRQRGVLAGLALTILFVLPPALAAANLVAHESEPEP
jgi:hypothetical protein